MLHASVFLFLLLLAYGTAALADDGPTEPPPPLDVRYLTVPEDKVYSDRFRYIDDLLALVLEKSGESHTLTAVEVPAVPTTRNVMFLKNDRFNVIWMHTDQKREKELRPIRFPIYRGLIGWRLLLIREEKADTFKAVQSLDQLRSLKAGLGHDWPDVKILENAGFNLRTSYNWEGIFNLLANDRIDYFPRGLVEIWGEMEKIKLGEIGAKHRQFAAIEDTIVIRYPTAFYLYTTKANEKIALALERGFEIAVLDGSFHRLFARYFGHYIERSKLSQRRVFTVDNPLLPSSTPLQRKALWFSLDETLGSVAGHEM